MINNLTKIDMEKLTQYLVCVMPEKLKLNELVPCRRCGWCCVDTTPRLLPGELELMYKRLNIDQHKFIEKYINTEWLDQKKEYALKSPCPFLKKDVNNSYNCQIYPFRPLVCRMFPFGGMLIVVKPCQKGKDIYNILWKWHEDHGEKEVINYQEIESMKNSESVNQPKLITKKSVNQLELITNSLKDIIKEKHPSRKFTEELDNPNDAKSHSEIVLFTGNDDFKRIRKYLKKRKNVQQM